MIVARGSVVSAATGVAAARARPKSATASPEPAAVPTLRNKTATKTAKGPKGAYLASVPIARMGTREDIAHAVRFFTSEAAGFITGQRLVVDGGRGLAD